MSVLACQSGSVSADVRACSSTKIGTTRSYSITSSARASSVGGTSRPSTLAVCMLMIRRTLSPVGFRCVEPQEPEGLTSNANRVAVKHTSTWPGSIGAEFALDAGGPRCREPL